MRTKLISWCCLNILFWIFYSSAVFAQIQFQKPVYTIPPPSSANLVKFEDYRVNLYNGIPDISINIYEIKVGDITVPITLRYHPSGNKVTDKAGWVGLGWSIDAGGSISRKIMGFPDERNINEKIKTTPEINPSSIHDQDYLRSIYYQERDVEPDIFSYNFFNHSGKFFFDRSQSTTSIKMVPYSPVKVSHFMTANQLSFELKDEKGNQIHFGKTSKDWTEYNNQNSVLWGAIAWKMEKIIAANKKDSITFSYTSSTVSNESISENIVVNDNSTDVLFYPSNPPIYTFSNDFVSSEEANNQEIVFPDGKVVFEKYTTNREDISNNQALKTIKVFRKENNGIYTLIKEVRFSYSYFIKGSDNATKRLRLDKVEIYGASNNLVDRQSFEYNNEITLPKYTSKEKDFWGYYNGKNNSSLIPRMNIPYNLTNIWIGSNILNGRDPDSNFMQAGILKKISYRTGGYTEFRFETNQYLKDSELVLAGGLRIKEIKIFTSPLESPLIRTFVYDVARANFHLPDYFFQKSVLYRYYNTIQCGLEAEQRSRSFFANPTADIVPYDGSPVTYARVTEYQGTIASNNGKIEYVFRDRGDAVLSASMVQRDIVNSYFYERGQILSETYFEKINGSFEKVKQIVNTYSAFPDVIYFNVGLVTNKKWILEGCILPGAENYESWVFSNYSISSDDNYITSRTETIFDGPQEEFAEMTEFHYDNFEHQQINRKALWLSDGRKSVSSTSYPLDYADGIPFVDKMKQAGILSYPIEQVTYLENQGVISITNGKITKYTDDGTGLSKEQLFLENSQPIPLSSFKFSNRSLGVLPTTGAKTSFQSDSRYASRILFNKYDLKNKPIELLVDNSVVHSYQWGYQSQLPIAHVENAKNGINQPLSTTSYLNLATINGTVSQSNFTTVHSGNIRIKLMSGTYLSSGQTFSLSYRLTGPGSIDIAGTFCINYTSGSSCHFGNVSSNTRLFSDMPAGDYTLRITATSTIPGGSSASVSYEFIGSSTDGEKEFFYEGFEEKIDAATGSAHAGGRYYSGDYQVPFIKPNSKTYYVDYRYLSSGKWEYIKKEYSNSMVLTEGTAIDEVRVYPVDAKIITYTYSPLIGLTSKTDPSGTTVIYKYDEALRLKETKNQEGQIITDYIYNYKP